MERNSQLTLAQILTRLSQILGQKQSGTFFVATDINTSCRFAIEEGKITHCTHKRDQGMTAVRSFLGTQGGSCSFSENQFAVSGRCSGYSSNVYRCIGDSPQLTH